MILAFLIGAAFKIPSSSVSWSTPEGCDGGMVPWARGDVIISGLGSPKEVLGERFQSKYLIWEVIQEAKYGEWGIETEGNKGNQVCGNDWVTTVGNWELSEDF